MRNLTTEQLINLRAEAGSYGDEGTVRDCTKALAGQKAAMARLVRQLDQARAELDADQAPAWDEPVR